jgi:hypothetical protein
MLKLVQTDWGVFDLAFDDPAADDAAAAVATVVYAILFSDSEAPESREADAYRREGWWDDPTAGTGLWHVRRQALSAAARAETLAMVRQALNSADPALTDVTVEDVSANAAAGSVSSMVLAVSGQHNGRQFLVKVPL